jgi:hypothetical protein
MYWWRYVSVTIPAIDPAVIMLGPRRMVSYRIAPLAGFCCSSGKLSAIEISSTAEILGCRRFGERQNSRQPRCSLAVFGLKQPQWGEDNPIAGTASPTLV